MTSPASASPSSRSPRGAHRRPPSLALSLADGGGGPSETESTLCRLQRRGSYQHPPRRKHNESVSDTRKGGSFRVPRKARPEFDFHESDRFLPVPPVNIQIAGADSDEDASGESTSLSSSLSSLEGNMMMGPGGEGRNHRRRSVPRLGLVENEPFPEYSPLYSPNSPWEPAPALPELWPSGSSPASHYQHEMAQQQQQQRRRSSTMHQFDPPRPLFADQFDEFVYQSQHMASARTPNPPEVNVEVPSDSDSSRRPSKASWVAAMSNASSYSNVDNVALSSSVGAGGGIGIVMGSSRSVCSSGGSGGRRASDLRCKPSAMRMPPPSMLAARPVLDRRSSHTGVLFPRRGGTPKSASPRRDSNTLGVPKGRSRGASLPGNMDILPDDIYRLRNFSLAGRRVINRGDSLKARSNHSINSTGSSVELRNSNYSSSLTNSGEDFSGCSAASSRRASRASHVASRRSSFAVGPGVATAVAAAAAMGKLGAVGGDLPEDIEVVSGPPPPQYRVAMLGASGVGKSSLTSQFLTSDHMNTYDNVEDDVQKVVSVCVDGSESQLVFIDHAHTDMSKNRYLKKVENLISTYDPNGYMIVYAVDEEESFEQADRILNYLRTAGVLQQHAVILVANKTDLVRSRVVHGSAGKAMAIKYGCKYIETSPGINHNVDELLVGMLAQIQLRQQADDQNKKSKIGIKVMDLLERVWKLQSNKSKSCGNLHVL